MLSHHTPISRRTALLATAALTAAALLPRRAAAATTAPFLPRDDDPPPLPAHAHNDYTHPRPLLDALALGYRSVEADVFPSDDPDAPADLLVAHSQQDLRPDRTLRSLYLDPLRAHVAARNGLISNNPAFAFPLILLLDIKRDAHRALDQIEQTLRKYTDLVTQGHTDHAAVHAPTGPVLVAISGDRPADRILSTPSPLVVLDGRPDDLRRDHPPDMVPLISAPWSWLTNWPGIGAPPPDTRARLRDHVRACHDEGRLVRFWGTPPTTRVWDLLLDQGADLVNVDDLPAFARHTRTRPPPRDADHAPHNK